MTLPQSFLAVAIFALLQGNAMAKLYIVCKDDSECDPKTKCVQTIKGSEIKRCLTICEAEADCLKEGLKIEFCDPSAKVCRLFCETPSQCPEGYTCKPVPDSYYQKCTKDSSNTPKM